MSSYYIGVDLGGTTVKMGLFTDAGELSEKWEIPTRTEENGRFILPDIAHSIEDKKNEKKIEIAGIGMGVPGPVTDDGVVLKCANLGWGVFSAKDEMTSITGIENVKIANDANIAALGEMWKGGGRGFDSIVMVTLGTGVGGGVIIRGRILTGSMGAGGEIGHIKVKHDETESCNCGGKGCLEQYASATGVVRIAKNHLHPGSEKLEDSCLAGTEITAKAVFDGAKAGDTYCKDVVEEFGRMLGFGLANVAQVVDPDAFVIGGGVSRAGEIIIDVTRRYYNDHVMFALQNKEFRLAELGNDAGIYGAVKLVIE
ncbi:MAG: ROK family glucokinase [Eubacterium sp.]|nr:ROK family glucokinase [Eubacterium sp.]